MALQMDKRMLVLIVAIVVIVAAAAAYLLTRDGGDDAPKYDITFEEYKDAAHPDVKVEIFDSEGNPVDGTVTVSGEVTFKIKITTPDEIASFALGTGHDGPIDTETTGFENNPVDGVNVYTVDVTIFTIADVTVTVDIDFKAPVEKDVLTLVPYTDPEKTGTKVVYEIDGKVVTGTYDLTKDTVVNVTITSPLNFTGIDVKFDPADAGTHSNISMVWGPTNTATFTATVKAGQDVTLTVTPDVESVDVTPNASLHIVCPEGVTVMYGDVPYEDGGLIPLTGDTELTIKAAEGAKVQYVMSWNGEHGTVQNGTSVSVDIPASGAIGVLRVGTVATDAESPVYNITFAQIDAVDILYDYDAEVGKPIQFNKNMDVSFRVETGDKTLGALYAYVAYDDGHTVVYNIDIAGTVAGSLTTTLKGFSWIHGDAVVSILPVYAGDAPKDVKVSLDSPDVVSVTYGGTKVGVSGFEYKAGSDLKIKYDGAGTLSYTMEWEVGATPISLTGEVQTPYGQEITIPVNDIIAKLGSATLTITFTDDDGKHTSTTDPMEDDKTETPAEPTEDKGKSTETD